MTLTEFVVPWWEVMKLRSEVQDSDGAVDDVQMSLHNAVFGEEEVGAGRTPYASPEYYGDITHPTGGLVRIMGRVAVRLGVPNSTLTEAVWRLDQAMGGGKSHGLIGLWHLASHPQQLSTTDLGKMVMAEAEEIAGKGKIRDDLGNPICVVLDCDNTTATKEDFGPAERLGERFLWRLLDKDYDRYIEFKDHTSNKAKLAEALRLTGRPVLVLIDEVMDYLRVTSATDHKGAVLDMAFLRALLDVVNDVPNCAAVVVMIASEDDNMAMTEEGKELREEIEDLLTRNASTTSVTSGGDFAEIIQRRLFDARPPKSAVEQVTGHYLQAMSKTWRSKVFDKLDSLYSEREFAKQVARCYPFHPALIALAENEWSHQAGFQRVRSTIRVFAAAAYEHAHRGEQGQWAPLLIDSGDLTLRSPSLRDSLLHSGLVADNRTQTNLREVAGTDIADPHNSDRGAARRLDETRDPNLGWTDLNPAAVERMATALFVRSLCPRPQGTRGATEAELHAASFVPSNAFGPGDAEAVAESLFDPDEGLACADHTPGQGKLVPKRWFIETRKTLPMLTRAEKKAISDTERNKAITDRAFALATDGPFDQIIHVDGGPVPPEGITTRGALGAIESAGIDRKHKTRLVILDSRWFSLLNGDDTAAREAINAAMGIGPNALTVQWASSVVFACANTALRSQARGLAAEWLARQRVAGLPAVQADEDTNKRARHEAQEAKEQLDRKVRLCYKHIAYLAPLSDHHREVKFIRVSSDTQTALNGADVWGCLREESKACRPSEFDKNALLHNLRDNDYGRPLSEIRDSFWSDPHKPLLPTGVSEIVDAIYDAVISGDIQLTNSEGDTYNVGHVGDVNLGSQSIRVRRAAARPVPKRDSSSPYGHTSTSTQARTSTSPDTHPTSPPGTPSPKSSAPDPTHQTKHMQINISVNTNIGSQGAYRLFQLLSELAECVDEGHVTHITQTTSITIASSEEIASRLQERAEQAQAAINIIKI
ncbi:MAG: DUF499 domain-containing protein [bacterium]|nr:DUF499 domain-containing protein [bacterium]